eukprot:PhF_6_TR40334/c0_g1_i2/m.59973
MRAFQYSSYGGPEVMKLASGVPIPSAPPGGYKIKVHAFAFNPVDFKRRAGLLKLLSPNSFPVIFGYDASGVIDAVGTGATKFKVGDPVYVRIGPEYSSSGTAAEYTVAMEKYVAAKPKNMSDEEAAAVPLAAMTALQALRSAGFKSGDKVFISGGAGGVGHYAIQLAKLMGASLIATSASAPKHALLKSLGADEVVDYKTDKFWEVYKDRRFDIGLDMTSETANVIKVVKPGGFVCSVNDGINGQSFNDAGVPVGFMLRTILWFMWRSLFNQAHAANVRLYGVCLRPNADDLDEMTKYIEDGKLVSVIKDQVFNGMDSTLEAAKLSESGRATGKVVVKLF